MRQFEGFNQICLVRFSSLGTSSYIKGFRGYFQLHEASAGARALNIDFGEDATTSLREIRNEELEIRNYDYFTLDGRKVAQPTQKGIYIQNGKKVVIK